MRRSKRRQRNYQAIFNRSYLINGSLMTSIFFALILFIELITGVVHWFTTGASTYVTRADSPLLYWTFILIYGILSVSFFRIHQTAKKLYQERKISELKNKE